MQGSNIMKHSQPYLSIPIVLVLVLATMPAQSAGAVGVRYAKEFATGSGDCSSWTNACTLQSALSGAVSGDEIWVKEGTHKPTGGTDREISFQLVSGVRVFGGFAGTENARSQRKPAANPTILSGDLTGNDGPGFTNNGENSYHVVVGSETNSSAILDGFTISGGNANGSGTNDRGGGMYNNYGSPSLKNVTLSNNSANMYGGGMDNSNSSPNLTKVTFSGNSATYGGGMRNSFSSAPTLTNVTLSGNSATDGGGMDNYLSSPILTNVTLSGNSATGNGGGMYNYSGSSPSLTNVIIASSSGGDCVNDSATLNAASANNLIEDTAGNACNLDNGVNGNITGSNPILGPLANYGGWTETHALLSGSPAIDEGSDSNCPGTDQRGVMRPQGNHCDIGAYEFYTGVYYVKPATNGAGNCASWKNACRLQTALNMVTSGDEIWVKKGKHKPTSDTGDRTATFQLVSGVEVYGGFAGTETARSQRKPATNPTILSGDLIGNDGPNFANNGENSYHVVTGSGTDATAILDGFTISGGNANGSGPDALGGGMFNNSGSPSLTNVTLSGNSATYGGGMYNQYSTISLTNVTLSGNSATDGGGGMSNWDADPSLTNVTLSGNAADYGGGMYNDSSSDPILTNVTLSGNAADYGGGMNNYSSSPNLTNVTLSGNSATDGGGMYNYSSYPTLTNVTLSRNSASYGGGMYNYSGSNPTLTNVTLSDNSATNGGGGMVNESSSPSLTDVTLSGNAADYGGGMYNDSSSDPILTNVTLSDNSASYGGGMNNYSSSPDLINVTLSGNSATNGGGMYNYSSSPDLTNVTLSGNSATNGGGMYNYSGSSPTLMNVIIASSSGGDCVNDSATLNTASANNLIEDEAANACNLDNGVNGNITGSNPKLGPLANYGGWTETHALLSGSPAIDEGTNSVCPGTDQRGVTRPIDGDKNGSYLCDIGAVEFQGTAGSLTTRSQGKYDGWVLESGEFTGKGGTKDNRAQILQVGDDAADKQYRVILSFGTAGIPDYAVITKVILKVKWAGVVGKNPMFTHNGLVVDIKKNKFFTLPALQINDFQAKPGKFKVGKFANKLFSGWYRAVLYKGTYPYINKKGRTQLRLRFLLDDNNDNVADILKLYSGNAILANRPTLIIQYYVP